MNAFASSLAFGKIGEGYIARWFQAKGYNVLPIYEKEIHEGKGPVIFGLIENLIAPDMLVFNTSKVFWIEAKTKSAFTWHRITQRWTTGIDQRHWNDYLKVSNLSPWPIWLLFLHLDGQAKDSPFDSPTGLFGNSLFFLSEHINHTSDKWGSHGMVYWAHESLKKIATLEEINPSVILSEPAWVRS